LTGGSDPSAADVAAGLQYAFDCGSGFGALGSGASTTCATSDDGTRTVRGRVRDKDGGTNEYTAAVTITNAEPVLGTVSGPTSPVFVGRADHVPFLDRAERRRKEVLTGGDQAPWRGPA
jgi:hypothetical protein